VLEDDGDLFGETLAEEVSTGASEWKDTVAFDLDGESVSLWITKSR